MKKLIKQYLKDGYTKEDIALELEEKKWPKRIIDRLLNKPPKPF